MTRPSSLQDNSAPVPDGQLKRGVLGVGGLVFMVVAAAAPLTVMAGVAPLGLMIGGVGAPTAYLAAGAVLIVFAVAFTRMTKYVSGGGAFYAYIAKGLGSGWGLAACFVRVVLLCLAIKSSCSQNFV